MLTIYKGEDTDFADFRRIVIEIKLNISVDISQYSGRFFFMGIERNFPKGSLSDYFVIVKYTAEETKGFPLGQNFGTFHLYDEKGRHAAIRKMPIMVALDCGHIHCCNEPVEIILDGIYNYERLGNLPTLNGETIIGDKTSTDYHIPDIEGWEEIKKKMATRVTAYRSANGALVLSYGLPPEI